MFEKLFTRTRLWLTCLLGFLQPGSTSLHAVPTVVDEITIPPPGQMIDVGGYRLHMHSTGSGSPTVILEQ